MQKKIIISIIFSLIAFNSLFCQKLPYRHFSEFNGNISAYIRYNFEERGQNPYNNCTFAQLMDDLEIKPIGYTIAAGYFDKNTFYQGGIALYFTKKGTEFSCIKDDHITIWWETSVLHSNNEILNRRLLPVNRNAKHYNSVMELEQAYPGQIWVMQHYDFYKNLKIKGVQVNNLL